MQHKWARGAGIKRLRGTLDSRLRAARKISTGKGGGDRQKGEMSMWKVDPRPEERGRVGRKREVKICRTVADEGSEGCRTWGGEGLPRKRLATVGWGLD